MAKIVRHRENSIETQKNVIVKRFKKHKRNLFLWKISRIIGLIITILFFLSFSSNQSVYVLGGMVLLYFTSKWQIRKQQKKLSNLSEYQSILEVGLAGEEEVLRELEYLSDDYAIIPDITINNGLNKEGKERTAQLDTVIIGKGKIYLLEVKNYKGKIIGHADEQYITIEKVSSGDRAYRDKRYNPIKQNHVHMLALRKLLDRKGFNNVFIQPVVVFTHPECAARIKQSRMPVTYSDEIKEYIQRTDKHSSISVKQRDELTSIVVDNHIETEWEMES